MSLPAIFAEDINRRVAHVQAAKRDVKSDFRETASRIANLPCTDSASKEVLAELCRWNNPGKDWDKATGRFLTSHNLTIGPPAWSDHPLRILFKTVTAMITGSDDVEIRKAHWDDIVVNPRWHAYPKTQILSDDQIARRERPLWNKLKKCKVGPDRGLMGMSTTYDLFMHSAVHNTVNRILAATGETVTRSEVDQFIGTSNYIRPIRQNSFNWRSLRSPYSRRVAIWTLATSCSIWGLEFVAAFLEFCTACLVGPVCSVTREECKEGFAACVAVATVARTREGNSAITNHELASCTRALWMFEVVELACTSAHGTLWTSRYITKTKGDRTTVTACDKWETPVDPGLLPSNEFSVTGSACNHLQNVNQDGTYGVSSAGRWTVVTKLEELGEQPMQDLRMRVTLTHLNTAAANNVLAVLERRGLWAYIQGQQECLTCAYKRALRHGFVVIIDGPEVKYS